MIHIINRPFNDEFSYNLFHQLLAQINVPYNAYYIWSNPPSGFQHSLSTIDFSQSPNVIIGVKDLLDFWKDYNFWHDTAHAGTKFLDNIAQQYPDTNFIILTSLENLHKEEINSPNIQILSWGGDWVNQHNLYQHLTPVIDKNFNTTTHYISLNRQAREHRLVLLSYLYGTGLNRYGNLSFLQEQDAHDCILDRISWEFDDRHTVVREHIIQGYLKFKDNPPGDDDYNIYHSGANNNLANFESSLRAKYRNSFVEIVTESSFNGPSFFLTEKTMHSFYGCNFPIILAGCGSVQHLRDIGFDLFDDIINHHYDLIKNPIDRITQAVDLNRLLLSDGDLVKQLWLENQDRFIKNITIANSITDYYTNRMLEQWKQLKWIQ